MIRAGASASIDALPRVAEAVEGRCEVLVDGGIRYGTDVLKALGWMPDLASIKKGLVSPSRT